MLLEKHLERNMRHDSSHSNISSFLHSLEGMRRIMSHESGGTGASPFVHEIPKKGCRKEVCKLSMYEQKEKTSIEKKEPIPVTRDGDCGINPRQGFDGGVDGAGKKDAPVKSGKEVGIILATNAPSFVNQFPWDTLAGQNGRRP